jgi:hypothetical protein
VKTLHVAEIASVGAAKPARSKLMRSAAVRASSPVSQTWLAMLLEHGERAGSDSTPRKAAHTVAKTMGDGERQ